MTIKSDVRIATSQWWSNLGLAGIAGGFALLAVGVAIANLSTKSAIDIIHLGEVLGGLGSAALIYSKIILHCL